MKTKPRQHISNKYNTCTIVTSPVYIGSKQKVRKKKKILILMKNNDCLFTNIQNLCNAVSDWLIKKINNPIETNETISCACCLCKAMKFIQLLSNVHTQ